MKQMNKFSMTCLLLVTGIIFSSPYCNGQSVDKGYTNVNDLLPSLEFVTIPAGSFTMGADIDYRHIAAWQDDGWRSIFIQDEFPVRNVNIGSGFEISSFEVTNAAYEKFDPEHAQWRGRFKEISTKDNEPVVYVSWEEAVAFTEWMSEQDSNYDYRLPTEAEWEYVARAGTRTPFNDGVDGNIYELNPFNVSEMTDRNYQWPYPFTFSNGCRSWVTWRPNNCTGVNDVYPVADDIRDAELTVGRHGPNGFGVYDMHGGVEEWTLDWYGPYRNDDQSDPAGYITGDFKVVRGGSHNNHVQHTRSANRMAAAVNNKHYFLGFRVVRVPAGTLLPVPNLPQPVRPWAEDVNNATWDWCQDDNNPVFSMTSLYELVAMKEDGSHYGTDDHLRQFGFDPDVQHPLLTGPLYTHNHSPTIAWTTNGDILVSWFSGESETGPELTLLASRGKRQADGSLVWTPPSEFMKAADRNMHGSNLLNNHIRIENGTDTILTMHQVASISVSGRWDKLGLAHRQSTDNGKTWTPVRMILDPDHGLTEGSQMQGNMVATSNGDLIFVTDDANDHKSNTASLVVTKDNGKTWERRGHSEDTPGELRIAGIHAAVAEIADINNDNIPDLLAFARDNGVHFNGKAPKCISTDGGHTWSRSASVFPAIGTGRRLTLTRLHFSDDHPLFPGKKPLLFTGFADDGIKARDGEGRPNTVTGLYAALSFDEGATWPEAYRRVISNLEVSEELEIEAAPWQRSHTLTKTAGQEDGYMTVTQSPDGMIYLTDGKIVYNFNLAWLMEGIGTAISEESNAGHIRLYPNPGKKDFCLEFSDHTMGPHEIQIRSSEGKTLYSKKVVKQQYAINEIINLDLAPGAYLVALSSVKKKYTSWFISQ
jgi:formylglycine-generating enzyme required for sulfatase activity